MTASGANLGNLPRVTGGRSAAIFFKIKQLELNKGIECNPLKNDHKILTWVNDTFGGIIATARLELFCWEGCKKKSIENEHRFSFEWAASLTMTTAHRTFFGRWMFANYSRCRCSWPNFFSFGIRIVWLTMWLMNDFDLSKNSIK